MSISGEAGNPNSRRFLAFSLMLLTSAATILPKFMALSVVALCNPASLATHLQSLCHIIARPASARPTATLAVSPAKIASKPSRQSGISHSYHPQAISRRVVLCCPRA